MTAKVSLAAVLPTSAGQITALSGPSTVNVPTIHAQDPFDPPAGNLNGQVAPTGQTWSVVTGTWSTNASGQASALNSNYARVHLDPGVANPTVSAGITVGADRSPVGVIMYSSGNRWIGATYQRRNGGRVRIYTQTSAGIRRRVQVNNATGLHNSFTITLAPTGVGQVEVFINGISAATYTMDATEQAELLGNTGVGLLNHRNPPARFDWFLAETP